MIAGKKILLGITGGIAAYQAVDLKKPTFIIVNAKVIDSGGKLSERVIREALEYLAITCDSEIGHSE